MAETAADPSGASTVELVFKNPARSNSDFRLQLPLSSSMRELKQRLQQEYLGNPAPETQTVRLKIS